MICIHVAEKREFEVVSDPQKMEESPDRGQRRGFITKKSQYKYKNTDKVIIKYFSFTLFFAEVNLSRLCFLRFENEGILQTKHQLSVAASSFL